MEEMRSYCDLPPLGIHSGLFMGLIFCLLVLLVFFLFLFLVFFLLHLLLLLLFPLPDFPFLSPLFIVNPHSCKLFIHLPLYFLWVSSSSTSESTQNKSRFPKEGALMVVASFNWLGMVDIGYWKQKDESFFDTL